MSPCLRPVPLLAVCSLAACAVGPDTSYVSAISAPTDATVIAAGIGSFMRTQLPAASTTLVLDPTPTDQASNALTPVLRNTLRQQGFAVRRSVQPRRSRSKVSYP
ncbi:MAG: type secretion system protein TrbH [Acetobacteraceae bacterium]|nr:type secretion system protein TrbH [Acetobacteraceae bacterium]